MRMRVAALALLGALAPVCAGGAPAAAQQGPLPLDTLRVDAASRAAAEIATGTRAVEVISAEQIRRSPARSVAELLQWAFGVDAMPRSPALVDVAVRGSSFEQVLVLVDGVRASDAQTGHFDLNLAVPLEQVERIEIVRGPASTLHGADAVGGVIHVVTRAGGGSAARAEGGSFGTAALAAAHSLRAAGVVADVAADWQRSDGHRPGTDFQVGMARAAVRAPLGERLLRVDAAHAARDFGADGFYGPYPSWEETRTTTASASLRAPTGARLAVEPTVSVRRNGDLFVLRRAEPDFYRNRHSTLQAGGEVVARYAARRGVRLAGGAEAFVDQLRSERLGDRGERRAALLAEVAAGQVGRLTGTAGVRADWHQAFGTFWSPSLAAAWWPAGGVRVRGSAGRAFRAPTWTERFYRDPANIGDPELAPERAWSAEAGLDVYPLPGVRVGAAGFLRHASQLIDWARPRGADREPWRTRNVEDARFRGLESEVVVDDLLGIRWTGRGSWLSLRATEAAGFTSKYALRPMAETLSLAAERAVLRGVTGSLRAQRARRLGEDPYLRLDARAAFRFARARVYLDLQNATDQLYPDITGRPAAGRALVAGVEWRAER